MASMLKFINPFKVSSVRYHRHQAILTADNQNHDVADFPGAHIPLEQVVRHRSVARTGSVSSAGDVDAADKEEADLPSSPGSGGNDPAPDGSGRQTLEALRAEVEMDLAAGGHDTAYDRTCSSPSSST